MKAVEPQQIIEAVIDEEWDGEYVSPSYAAQAVVEKLTDSGFLIIHRGY